jgi:hypothetical protein
VCADDGGEAGVRRNGRRRRKAEEEEEEEDEDEGEAGRESVFDV